MKVSHVIKLLDIANNGLPTTEWRYDQIQKQVDILKINKRALDRDIAHLDEQVATSHITLHSIIQNCDRQMARLLDLQKQRAKLESFVNNYKNNDHEFIKLKNSVQEEVLRVLSNKKRLLKLAVLSIFESIRNNPDKYSSLTNYHHHLHESSSLQHEEQHGHVLLELLSRQETQ